MADENKKAVTKEEFDSLLRYYGVLRGNTILLNDTSACTRIGSITLSTSGTKLFVDLNLTSTVFIEKPINTPILIIGFGIAITNKEISFIENLAETTVEGKGEFSYSLYTGSTLETVTLFSTNSGTDTQNLTIGVTNNILKIAFNHSEVKAALTESGAAVKYYKGSTVSYKYRWEISLT